MNYIGIEKDSLLNGDGIRVILWVSGCEHHCWRCQNPSTWNPDDGLKFTKSAEKELFGYLDEDYVSGITFSGGDPLHPANIETVTKIAEKVKRIYGSTRTVWIYTGYMYEDVKDTAVMQFTDVLVDGEYIDKLKDITYPWAGSTNQRVIDVKSSLKEGRLILHDTDTGAGFTGSAEIPRCCG